MTFSPANAPGGTCECGHFKSLHAFWRDGTTTCLGKHIRPDGKALEGSVCNCQNYREKP